ncbi:MAG: hypothetical protein JXR51_11560 [Bacteroidales bacterium]|nr:hypothetical protein [Bacteroidales bacterium]MBN2757807.1 hypothetical protein [Bacteroidales bacterium]
MSFNNYITTNLVKLLVILAFFLVFDDVCFSQEKPAEDPINLSLQKEKQEYEGINLTEKEYNNLENINNKYNLSEEEVELRNKQKSGFNLSLIEKFKIRKSYRKDYLRNKKYENFKKKKIQSLQSKETMDRMKQRDKELKRREKLNKRKEKLRFLKKLFK